MPLTKIIMPKTGADMEEGRILSWKKREGEPVKKGEILLEIETDKATMEVEAPEAGVVLKRLYAEGETVPATCLIALLGEGHESPEEIGALAGTEEKTAFEPPRATAARPATVPPPGTSEGEGRIKASPLARRLAQEKGIELSLIQGTGSDGRIEKDDVLRAAEARKAVSPAGDLLVPLSPMRRAIGRRVLRSKQQVPEFSVTMTMDMTAPLRKKEELRDMGRHVSVNDLLILAVSRVLVSHPDLNAELEGDCLRRHRDIHIGLAVGTEDGLYVPVIRHADKLNLGEIATESQRLTAKAERKQLTESDLAGGTFTLTNLGMFGVDFFTAILVPAQTGILSVGRVVERPARGEHGGLVWNLDMAATLTVDHRVVDGAAAAQFLSDLRTFLKGM
jgi:pyruvate dehydrogenase E2 component (dihydrolipoamide acetyltransferase)